MSYLIDTDWVVDYLNGNQPALDLFARLTGHSLAVSLIAVGEVYEGIYYGNDPTASEAGFRQLLRVLNVIDLDEDIMRLFARIRGDLRRRGLLIGDPDILIAATAVHHGLILVTRNLRDFARVPRLTLC